MIDQEKRILILGIGNYILGDEGVGVHFARSLENENLPAGVACLDGGTAGFQLMEYLESYSKVIMVDATLDDRPPGTIRLIEPKFSTDYPNSMSTHDVGLRDLIEGMALMGKAANIQLLVVSVADISNLKVGLSPEVEAALPVLKKRCLSY